MSAIGGNGVIDGWEITASGAFEISISEGFGNINFYAARTGFPNALADIPPNSINYVYAQVLSDTRFTESVDFFISSSKDLTDPSFLLLSEIITGSSSIDRIDNSVRQEINFIELIKAAVKQHKHRGGPNHPSKIDLVSEVKGQLPAFRIADFDAEKITTGTFDVGRIPLLDHQDLKNVGLLTHPQLDSFVKNLEASNKEIFGEIMASDFLQFILASKLIHDDPNSPYYVPSRTFDQNMINEIAIIPGITPNTIIDFDNTTATINLTGHDIEGVAPTTGTSFYVNYDTALAWHSAYDLKNLIVVNDSVTLAFSDTNDRNILVLENFENATVPNQLLSGTNDGGQELFKRETVIIADSAKIIANASLNDVEEGFYSGKFTTQQSFRVQYKKEFNQAQDWTTYDSFVINVKCLDFIHGPVKIFFFKDDQTKSGDFVLLSQDEVTINDITNEHNFEKRVIRTDLITFRESVKGFIIYSDDIDNPFSFLIDNITIQRAILLPENGLLKLRYSTSSQVVFSSIQWNSLEPSGTNILIRARSANGTVFLTRSDFTPFLSNGQTINLKGTDIEIEIEFDSDQDRLQAPILNSVKILILSEAELDGFKIENINEFSRGTELNVDINDSPVSISINSPIYVSSYYFCLANSVNQVHPTTNTSGSSFVEAELALFGQNAPIAPNQVFSAIESGERRVSLSRLFEPKSVIRNDGKLFVIADTFNDRILEFNENGDLLSGVGSINYEHDTNTFPISACVDSRTGILYIVWSKKISFATINVSKITVQSNTRQIQLIENFDKILDLTRSEIQNINPEGQILPIYLSDQNLGLITDLSNENTYLSVSSDALTGGIDESSVFSQVILTSLGIPIFIGKFAYIDGIFCPTYANKTSDGGFIVANATIGVKKYVFTGSSIGNITKTSNTTSIIEIDKNNNIIYGTDKINFSPFIPGKVDKISKTKLLIGGIKSGGQLGTVTDDDLNFRSIFGDSAEKIRRKNVLNTLFFGNSTNSLSGAAIVLDRSSGATLFEYLSPDGLLVSDVIIDKTDGSYVIAESSLNQSGRIIKTDTLGNITFSFGEGTMQLVNSIQSDIDGTFTIST